jgi:GT2 family glycosyltransferase
MKIKLSVCIPTYKRFDNFLKKNIELYLKSEYIDEIIVSDEDGDDYNKLKEHFQNESKLKLFKNDKILGVYFNKSKSVSYANNDWVCLADSDNYMPDSYFKTWHDYIELHGLNNKSVYMPQKTYPVNNSECFNYEEFGNLKITKYNVNDIKLNGNYECMLNTANYIFNKYNYLKVDEYMYSDNKCNPLDTVMKNFLLLLNNSTLTVVPNMIYYHAVHHDGCFAQNSYLYEVNKVKILDLYTNIEKYYHIPYTMTLREWQKFIMSEEEIIFNSSEYKDQNDNWVDFTIGVNWSFINHKHLLNEYSNVSRNNLLLTCINPFTDNNRRKNNIINRVKIVDTLYKNNFINYKLEPEIYFKILPLFKFVTSPEGNGIDCHRHYEALIAGCIPIVEDNPLIRSKYKDCPILYTNDYSEITEDYLQKKYEEMIDQVYDFSTLMLSTYNLQTQKEIKDNGNFWGLKHGGKKWYID